MPWFRVDDNLALHVKVLTAGNAAMGLWVRAGAWSANGLTDGFIPADVADDLGTDRQIQRLIAAGLWKATEDGYWMTSGHWVIVVGKHRRKIPRRLRKLVMTRDDGMCQECGSTERPTLDHIHPYSLGGVESEANLQVLCLSCNSRKGARV